MVSSFERPKCILSLVLPNDLYAWFLCSAWAYLCTWECEVIAFSIIFVFISCTNFPHLWQARAKLPSTPCLFTSVPVDLSGLISQWIFCHVWSALHVVTCVMVCTRGNQALSIMTQPGYKGGNKFDINQTWQSYRKMDRVMRNLQYCRNVGLPLGGKLWCHLVKKSTFGRDL